MIVKAIKKIVDSQDLSETEMTEVVGEMMSGKATDSQIAAFVTALRMKGETVEELTAAATVMRKKVVPIHLSIEKDAALLDTCGTGGDMTGTFNISTVSAFVVAGAGVKVVKHGNHSVISKCGSADLIQALGINIDVSTKKGGAVYRGGRLWFLVCSDVSWCNEICSHSQKRDRYSDDIQYDRAFDQPSHGQCSATRGV